jgi:tetratricopeptide (TPR) repeat protein
MSPFWKVLLCLAFSASASFAQEMHDHGVPEKLGQVSFPISCEPAVQQQFNRGIALLHSFAYPVAAQVFQSVAKADPACGMAHWGIAMTYYHPVWASQTLPAATFPLGQKEIQEAVRLGAHTEREQQFIHALALLYQDTPGLTTAARMALYEPAMAEVARANSKDTEAQVFYALALLANAPATDKTHAKQQQAIAILEPLHSAYPDHPGIAHYLIHACDSQALAQRGLPAARAYAKIAPSAPHALHMPSHIFTRLGLWDDSIQSNLASWQSAHQQSDQQGELHAMDYLVYAYLQTGRDQEAANVIQKLKEMPSQAPSLDMQNFAIAYAATAMPIRVMVERGRWAEAASVSFPSNVPPSVAAIAVWAKGLGLARTGHAAEARLEADHLHQIEAQLRTAGDSYWSAQTGALANEVMAWSEQASGHATESLALMRAAADQEDAIEKLPVTPGPIIPAREQLGDLLLQQGQPELARKEFQTALAESPGRQNAMQGLARASGQKTQTPAA